MAALTYQREIWEIYSLNRPANRDGVFAILHEGRRVMHQPLSPKKYFFDAALHLTTSANSSHIVGTQELNS